MGVLRSTVAADGQRLEGEDPRKRHTLRSLRLSTGLKHVLDSGFSVMASLDLLSVRGRRIAVGRYRTAGAVAAKLLHSRGSNVCDRCDALAAAA